MFIGSCLGGAAWRVAERIRNRYHRRRALGDSLLPVLPDRPGHEGRPVPYFRAGLQRVLSRSGYRVDTAANGRDALKTFSEAPGRIDLVITDETMPGIPGIELSRKIREMRSDIPVILCTGLTDTVDEQTMKTAGIRELLVKPTDMGELKSVVSRILKE